jgi:hypothetical protein
MKKSNKKKEAKAAAAVKVPEPACRDVAPNWTTFFRDQRNPVLRSQLITALMAGKQLEVERLPVSVLLDVVVLSMAARTYHDAEIIDDYQALLRRTDELWKDPMWTKRTFDQFHMSVADFIIRGSSEFVCYEDQYIPDLVGWLLEHDPPAYLERELAA